MNIINKNNLQPCIFHFCGNSIFNCEQILRDVQFKDFVKPDNITILTIFTNRAKSVLINQLDHNNIGYVNAFTDEHCGVFLHNTKMQYYKNALSNIIKGLMFDGRKGSKYRWDWSCSDLPLVIDVMYALSLLGRTTTLYVDDRNGSTGNWRTNYRVSFGLNYKPKNKIFKYVKESEKDITDRINSLSSDTEYEYLNMHSITDQKAINEICDHLLGDDWYVIDPLTNEQVNTHIVYEIEMKYKKVK